MLIAPRKSVVAWLVCALALVAPICEAKRSLGGSNRKSSSGGGYTTRRQPTSVTKPTYNTNSASSNSHADAAKLSYPNYNSQPNRPVNAPPTSNNQPIGWNVPSQSNAGPPPAYSASNVAGGAKTNIHEPPPVYQKPNYGAAPPSYNQATGTNYGAAPQYHSPGVGATYTNPNNLPPGANYYSSPSHIPGYHSAGYGGGYHPPGGMPAGANYYPSSQSLPQGATYLPAGNALPPGAVFYSSPPQQTSSGLGFGSGLAAGALGGAILGHVLTPTQTRVVEHAPATGGTSGADSGHDRVIIINNGQVMNTTNANGVTVVNTGENPAPAPAPGAETPAPLAPMAPASAAASDAATNPAVVPAPAAGDNSTVPANPEQPPAGGIICVLVRVNETDPNDNTKMIEIEKIACYPAPPPAPQAAAETVNPNNPAASAPAAAVNPVEGSAPLAPMQPITAGSSSQQLQQESTLIGDQTIKSADNASGPKEMASLAMLMCFVLNYLVAYN